MVGATTMSHFDPDWVVCPGETLREWMEENGHDVRRAAYLCRVDVVTFEDVLNGTMPIEVPLAVQLYFGTGIRPRVWLNLERNYRQGLAAGKVDATARFCKSCGVDLTPGEDGRCSICWQRETM